MKARVIRISTPSLTDTIAMSDRIRNYTQLREFIRASLRNQNPEWVESNGDSPLCDSYEARFAELLGLSHSLEDDVADS
jgi:hypothetical protein